MGKRKRLRNYIIFGRTRGGPFTSKSGARGHPWIYTIRATSIRQAYALAYQEVFAPDAKSVGILMLECDWWHYACEGGPDQAMEDGLIAFAPYLREPRVTVTKVSMEEAKRLVSELLTELDQRGEEVVFLTPIPEDA